MDFRQIAGDLIMHAHEERWTTTQAKIEAALHEAYRVGFLDGEDSAKASQTEQDELDAVVTGVEF
jgi:hypothetical protein